MDGEESCKERRRGTRAQSDRGREEDARADSGKGGRGRGTKRQLIKGISFRFKGRGRDGAGGLPFRVAGDPGGGSLRACPGGKIRDRVDASAWRRDGKKKAVLLGGKAELPDCECREEKRV